jgi:hypothetical protein
LRAEIPHLRSFGGAVDGYWRGRRGRAHGCGVLVIPAELLARPFTPGMARACGVQRWHLEGSRVRRVFHGVYVGATVAITPEILAEAIGLVLPKGAVVSGTTAALLRGVDVRRHGDHALEVTSTRRSSVRRTGIRTREALLEPADVCEIAGVPVTSAVRTAFDLARNRDLIEAVVGVDAMLNRGGVGVAELAEYVDSRWAWWGIRWARLALAHAEPLAESPMESRQRMRLVLADLPRPTAQHTLLTASGLFVARLDHAYEEFKVAPEYDGGAHEGRWRYDNERQQSIRDEGWWHRRYTSLTIRDGWEPMVSDVRSALMARGWHP